MKIGLIINFLQDMKMLYNMISGPQLSVCHATSNFECHVLIRGVELYMYIHKTIKYHIQIYDNQANFSLNRVNIDFLSPLWMSFYMEFSALVTGNQVKQALLF